VNREDREELKEMLKETVSPIVKLQEEHHRTLFGDGSESHQGLRVDVDRLKQEAMSRSRHFWVIYPVLILTALKVLWGWITGNGKVPVP
jgi:hypothetical protein